MLSDDLKALSDRFAAYRSDGMEVSPDGIAALESCLRDLAHQARCLEATAIATPTVTVPEDGLPENVIQLAPVRARNRGRTNLPDRDPPQCA